MLSDRLPDRHDFVIVARPEIGGPDRAGGHRGVTKCLEEALAEQLGGGRST